MPKELVWLCADDYAISEGVSAGVRKALAAGRLSATSAMTTRPAWPAAARALRALGVPSGLGLHLDLTLGPPLGPMPTFAAQGKLPNVRTVIGGALRGTLALEEIRAEIIRQLDRFEEEFGAPPDFVDGHQHVHALPGVRSALLEALEQRPRGRRPWLRDPAERFSRIIARRAEAMKAGVVAGLAYGFGAQARARGFSTNDGFSGFSGFDPKADYGRAFAAYLRATGPRHLVMCHPGEVDEELTRADPVTWSRPRELGFLLSDDFPKLLNKMGKILAPSAAFTFS